MGELHVHKDGGPFDGHIRGDALQRCADCASKRKYCRQCLDHREAQWEAALTYSLGFTLDVMIREWKINCVKNQFRSGFRSLRNIVKNCTRSKKKRPKIEKVRASLEKLLSS